MKTDPSQENDKTGLTISRIFDAPREKMWEAWTNPEMIKRWWGPKGFSAPAAKVDLREGGKYLYAMRGKPGPDKPERDFWSGGVFQEIVPGEKIVATDYFTDEKGNQVPASYYGMNPGFPTEMTVIATFEDAGENKTKFTLRYPTRGDMPVADREGMNEGWNQSLDKLAEALK